MVDKIFPDCDALTEDYPLQSKLFGHRFKQSQTLYEYVLEFLVVAFSEKEIGNKNYPKEDLFPIDIPRDKSITYFPQNNIGLKRFVFFDKSKQDGKFELDRVAYEQHLDIVREKIEIQSNDDFLNKDYIIKLMQNLLYGFGAVIETRSWFAQSLLPICPETLITEFMGVKSKRNKPKNSNEWDIFDDEYINKVDNLFELKRYNFMCRGGEVYYLHLLKALNDFPQYKESIECGFKSLVNQFNEFSTLCNFIEDTWVNESGIEIKPIDKTLGAIPIGFDKREERLLKELENLLHSDLHPFEKIEILSYGIILQIITMCHEQARYASNKEKGFLLYDVNCYRNKSDEEVKKLAISCYVKYEQDYIDALYMNVAGNTKSKTEKETIDSAIDDSIKVYKKLGKKIGIVRPINEKGTRFTLSENILKFLVISLIKPNTRMTLDRFLDKVYNHFNIVISKEHYKLEVEKGNAEYISDLAFLDRNKNDLQVMLKECGFLRELSDSTSIVRNPYGEV